MMFRLSLVLFTFVRSFSLVAAEVPADAKQYFIENFAESCQTELAEDDIFGPEALDFSLYRFTCQRGAYNITSVILKKNQMTAEIYPLSFAVPEISSEEPVRIVGYSTTVFLVNVNYSKESKELITFSKWRGIGDAFAFYAYLMTPENSILKKIEIDTTFDGEINPSIVVDF